MSSFLLSSGVVVPPPELPPPELPPPLDAPAGVAEADALLALDTPITFVAVTVNV